MATERARFVDALRGVGLVLMVLNHTARWWLPRPLGWPRYWLIYGTLVVGAPIFLFLVGFALAAADAAARARGASGAGRHVRRGLQIALAGYLLTLAYFPRDPVLLGGVLHTIGFSIALSPLALRLARSGAGRWAVLAAAGMLYASFALQHRHLRGWVAAHPDLADLFFGDFPLWPWFAIVLAGIAIGSRWVEMRALGPEAGAASSGGSGFWGASAWRRPSRSSRPGRPRAS